MTARELLTRSFQLIGVLASGETMSADMATDAINALNDMLESWSVDGLLVPAKTQENLSLVAATQDYNIGTSLTFNTLRPVGIMSASVLITGIEYPLEIITAKLWSELPNKSLTSTIPLKLYYEPAAVGIIHIWPVPSTSGTLRLYSEKPFASYGLDTVVTLPPGFSRALRYNLAVESSAEYGKEASPSVQRIAVESKANVIRNNHEPVYLKADNYHGKRYNINTDT